MGCCCFALQYSLTDREEILMSIEDAIIGQPYQAQYAATSQLANWAQQNSGAMMVAGGGLLSSLINRGTAKQVAQIQQNTAIGVAKIQQNTALSVARTQHNTAICIALINQQTALKSLAAQLEMHQNSLTSQETIAKLQRELQERLTEYQQCCEDQRLTKRFQHEEWVAYFQRETQWLMAWENLRAAKAKTDDDEIRQRYPLNTPQRVLLDAYAQYYQTRERIPPLVVLSPLALEFETFPLPHAAQGFARIGTMVASGLHSMLEPYQLHGNCSRPVRYQGIDWRSKSLFGESALSTLNYALKSVPTIVVEERLEGDEIVHYLGWWNVMGEFRYQKVFSIAWKEVLYPLAREYAREWSRIRSRKLNNPHSEYAELTPKQIRERFIQEGGDDEINFQKLEEEEENQRHKERVGHDYRYHVNDEKYVKELAHFLTVCHGIIVGLAVYFDFFIEAAFIGNEIPRSV